MCLVYVYPEARSEAVEEIGLRAFFDSLGDVELVTQCRYQAPKTLQEAIETVQMVEGCRLASEASARPAHRTQLTSAGQEAPLEPTTSFTPEDFVRACHAVAGAPATPVSTPRPSGDANSDRSAMVNASGGKPEKAEDRRYKTLQESLKKMAIELKEQRAEAQNQVT